MPKRLLLIALFMGLSLMAWSYDTRADFWGWMTDFVTEPSTAPEEVSLGQMALPPDAIVTAPGEVRIIELGRDILELYPSTAVTVKTTVGNVTTVQVITGTVRAKVAKRKSQTFRVETLMLVGTVKGTVFEVSTTSTASAVSVYEGRVAVKAKGGVGGIDVTPGKTGTVSAQDRGAKVGDTPRGGAAAAAKQASKATRSANKTAAPPGQPATQATGAASTSPEQTSAAATPAGAGSDNDYKKDKKDKKDKKEKGDKKQKMSRHDD